MIFLKIKSDKVILLCEPILFELGTGHVAAWFSFLCLFLLFFNDQALRSLYALLIAVDLLFV